MSESGKSKDQQLIDNKDIPKIILEYETLTSNSNSIVVGDLNYRPFDKQLTRPDFLHAIGQKDLINSLQGFNMGNPFFYNPMWNLLGDYDYLTGNQKVAGTFYWYADDVDKYHWNLIDGVLLRPSIMDKLDLHSLKILIDDGNGQKFLKKTIANTGESFIEKNYPDHLPIVFQLNTV
jgi:hypothetical protein